MKSSVLLALVSAMFLASLAMPAYAQASRTFVSGTGDDGNPCSRTQPCKTFAGAISKTSSPGEIDCLDSAGFGGLTITKAVDITCDVSNGGVLVSGTNGFNVNLASATAKVVLSGLNFEGLAPGASPGLSGIGMIGLGQVIIRNTTIRNFSVAGVNVQGKAGTPKTRVVIEKVLITNSGIGVDVAGASGAANQVEVLDSVIDSNKTGVSVTGPSTLALSASTLSGQATAITVANGGQVISYGNNVITGTGKPTSTLKLE